MGFLTKQEWNSDSLHYLYQLADALLYRLSKLSDIELLREETVVELTDEEITSHKDRIPYSIGMEYVDDNWLRRLWENLLLVFQTEIKSYQGTVAMFFTEHNAKINIAGRVFFHLVESKQQDYPFAFMATYSVKQPKSKKALHTPLKNALVEFKKDEKQLLSLLSTVTKVAEESRFISNLMESGELCSPLKFTSEEAYQFFREIPIYETAGVLCRVPDWWRKKSNSLKMMVTIGEKSPSKVGLDALMDFSPSLTMDGEQLTKEELKEYIMQEAHHTILSKQEIISLHFSYDIGSATYHR
jgi:non-specific serine/threonine protein kinase